MAMLLYVYKVYVSILIGRTRTVAASTSGATSIFAVYRECVAMSSQPRRQLRSRKVCVLISRVWRKSRYHLYRCNCTIFEGAGISCTTLQGVGISCTPLKGAGISCTPLKGAGISYTTFQGILIRIDSALITIQVFISGLSASENWCKDVERRTIV